MVRTAIGMLSLILALFAVYWWFQSQDEKVDPVLKTIVSSYWSETDGKIYDPTNSLGVNGKNDVSFTGNDKELTIQYGKMQFKVRLDGDQGHEATGYLSKLGLQIQKAPDGQWIVKYNGEAVKQFE